MLSAQLPGRGTTCEFGSGVSDPIFDSDCLFNALKQLCSLPKNAPDPGS